MARPTHDFSPTLDAEIRQRRARGESAEAVAAAIGQPQKARTIARRYPGPGQQAKAPRPKRKNRTPPTNPGPVAPPASAAPPSEESSPNTEDLGDVDPASVEHWIKTTERMAQMASNRGETGSYGTLMARLVALYEHRRKSTPVEKEDPNENPDMVEAAKRVRAKWHKLADSLVRVSNSPIAETIARILRPDES